MSDVVLSVRGLSLSFRRYAGGVRRCGQQVLRGLNLNVRAGEVLAVVGASGSGKSLLAHAVLGILPSNAVLEGEICYMGQPLNEARQAQLRGREIALVPQSVQFLDPLMRVGRQMGSDAGAVRGVFGRYRLEAGVAEMFPHQLSGGMARRVLCATAALTDAKLLIADEPTPGMGGQLAREAMSHFRDLATQGAAVMLITHDIELAAAHADRIAVFYAGSVVEAAPVCDFAAEHSLRHPYTKALWRAMPGNGMHVASTARFEPDKIPDGCAYAIHCENASGHCLAGQIETRTLRGGEVCCPHAH